MDERKPQSEEIEDWVKELLPDGGADMGMWQHPELATAPVKIERQNTCLLSVDSHPYQRNLSQHQLMQTSGGCNSASLMVKREQEALNVLQHPDQTTLQKLLETKGGVVLERGHPRMQQMPTLHQSQNLTLADQLNRGNQTQGMLLGSLQASLESTSQVDLTNSIDWVNQMYQKCQQVKEMYLSQFIFLHHKMQESKRQAPDAETANRCEKSRAFMERAIRLLNASKSELVHAKKERVYQMMSDALKYVSQVRPRNSLYTKQTHQVEASGNHIEARQIQQRENHLQFSSGPTNLHQPLRPGGALSLPQSSLNSFSVGSSAVVHKVDAPLPVNSYQYNNLMRPTQQWVPQGNVAPSPRKGGSQIGFDPRALRMLLHPSGGVSQYNNLGNSQQTVTSSRNIFNSLDYPVNPMIQSPVSMLPLQNNQQDQVMKRQKMKQPVQQFMNDKNKQPILQKRNEDTKLRRFVGINQKWSPVIPPSSPYAISPQNSQQSSSQLELKDLSSKFPKSATPSLSSASPTALPSPLTPLTPLTPSSMPADSAKSPLLEESSKLAKYPAVASQPPSQDTNRNQLATDTQRSTKSCLHRESISFGDKQSSQAKQDPLKRLVEVVKSVSSKALHATLRDINAVTSLGDRVAGNFRLGKPTKVISHDLTDDIIVNTYDGTGMTSRLKRELDTVALDDYTAYAELCASGSMKRLKTESNNLLLEEIKEINKTLIEVAVDVMNLEDVSRPGSDEGTLIRCLYIPLGFSGNIKIPNTSKLMFPNLILELFVSADYPNSSPTVLENPPSGFCDAEGGNYLWMKAKSNFILSLRKFTQPMSVKDMAETWNVCAREVFNELAGQMGGGSFSSTYGKWETCAVAAS